LQTGVLILNADDWGRDRENTRRIYECVRQGTVSSASAMVFMEDSERAASLAREKGVDTGLHLNFTTPYTATSCPPGLLEHQRKLASYLNWNALAQVVFHPGLAGSFDFVVKAQLDEFGRFYGAVPERMDGHHLVHQHGFRQASTFGDAGAAEFFISGGRKESREPDVSKGLGWQARAAAPHGGLPLFVAATGTTGAPRTDSLACEDMRSGSRNASN